MEIQWSLVLFTAIAGSGAWLFACVGINEFKGKNKPAVIYALALAIILLAVGGICSATHLAHPERMLAALNRPTSGIFTEAVMIFILIALALVFIVLEYRKTGAVARKILGALAIVFALAFCYSTGESYTMSSRAAWDTPLFVIACIFAPATTGTALWTMLLCLCKKEFSFSFKDRKAKKEKAASEAAAAAGEAAASEEALAVEDEAALAEPVASEAEAAPAAAPLDLASIKIGAIEVIVAAVLALATQLAYGIATGTAFGDSMLLYWIGVIACGTVVPLVCGILALRKPERALPFAVVALVGGAVGVLSFRAFQWLVGEGLMSLFGVVI